MYDYPLKPINDISDSDNNSSFWLLTGIAVVALLLLEPEKKHRQPSQTPSDLKGLEGRLRSCDAWFESRDKKGRLIHRCFIYKPTCNTKRCKADPKLNEPITEIQGISGYTSTCRKFGKNRLGRRQCLQYAPTCGSADEGCRTEAAPLPSEVGKRTQKDFEIEADALAQELANEKNFALDFNKKLMRDVLSYGGISPHRRGFMSEEYKGIPKKYKRADGIPMDELAQEMGIDESALADQIYQAEASFLELKAMRGGKTATRFKKTDFIGEAWDRMRSGRGFFGYSKEKRLIDREGTDIQPFFKGNTNEVWFIDTMPRYNEKLKDWFHSVYELDSTGNYKPAKLAVSTDSLKEQFLPGLKKTRIKEQQLTLFGGLGYKGYDEEGALNSAIKSIGKFQGKPLYVFSTYTGIKINPQKPPYGQQYYRVNPDGSADYVEYSKGETTEKRIRWAKSEPVETKNQMTLFSELKPLWIPAFQETWQIDKDDCKWKRFTARAKKELGIKGKGSTRQCKVIDADGTSHYLSQERIDSLTKPMQQRLFGIKFNPDVTENQIRARVIQPAKIIRGTYFVRQSTTPGVSYVMGQDRSGQVKTQSIRFDRRTFDNLSAKRWFNSNIKRIKQRDRQGYIYLKPNLSGGKTHSEDYFSSRQQEMFPKLRRELVLEQEDNASILTVDPLYICLERQGWSPGKVKKYQESISAKMTPDMFGKIERLTGAEVMLQEQIQKCLERR